MREPVLLPLINTFAPEGSMDSEARAGLQGTMQWNHFLN
jgi:hypothetical protein